MHPEAGQLESVLMTFGEVEINDDHVIITGVQAGLQVVFDNSRVTVRVEKKKHVDLAEGETDVNLVIFSFAQAVESGKIRLVFSPQSK